MPKMYSRFNCMVECLLSMKWDWKILRCENKHKFVIWIAFVWFWIYHETTTGNEFCIECKKLRNEEFLLNVCRQNWDENSNFPATSNYWIFGVNVEAKKQHIWTMMSLLFSQVTRFWLEKCRLRVCAPDVPKTTSKKMSYFPDGCCAFTSRPHHFSPVWSQLALALLDFPRIATNKRAHTLGSESVA